MTFSNSKIEINPQVLMIGNETVEKTCTAKLLGILIDDKLNWKDHTTLVQNKISSGL